MTAIPPFAAWSLKTKMALCSGVVMFAFAGAVTTWALRTVQADLVASVTDAQNALVRGTADDIDENIAARRIAALKTAAVLPVTATVPGNAPDMDAFLESHPVTRDLFDVLAIVDATGRFTYDGARSASRIGSSIADREYFKKLLAGAPSAMSSPLWARYGVRQALVVFAVPLHTRDGAFSGALLASIDLFRPNFLGRIGETNIGRAGHFTVIENGARPIMVMHPDLNRILAPVDPSGNPDLARALAGFEGTQQGVADGVEALRTSVTLHEAPWVLVAEYPTAEAFAGLHARERDILGFAGALCVIAAGIAWLTADWLLRPLKRLQTLISSPSADLGVPLPPASFGSEELATLVTAYNAQTERRRGFEDRMKASEQRLRAITDNLPVLISYIDRNERYTFLNATFKSWLDIDPVAVLGRPVSEVMVPRDYAARREYMQRCLSGERVTFELDGNTLTRDVRLHTVYVPDRGTDGQIAGFYTLTTDVTELKDAQRRLALLARSDSLTGLPNRYHFNEFLPLALARCARAKLALALMFIDIDHFKQINDTYGHAAGDAVLKEFAVRLQRAVRSIDLVARLGGDEFVVVLEGLHGDREPNAAASRILADVSRPFDVLGRQIEVTTSVGIAFQATAGASAPQVLALADKALYEAKAGGRNTFRILAAPVPD
jgi:diguanylate cyclase (GGDEF)-like protein/PAS domain S-box-containing protein